LPKAVGVASSLSAWTESEVMKYANSIDNHTQNIN
jgi:predicted DNA-binding transcriptional regulator AlpA